MDLTLSSIMGSMNLGSTTMGFNYTTGEAGRNIELFSTHVPTSFADSIRIGAQTGIDTASITTLSLMMHMAASNAILQLTDREGKMNASVALDKAYKVLRGVRSATTVGASSTTSGRISFGDALLKGFKETHGLDDEEKDAAEESSSSKGAKTGGPMGDPDDSDEEKDLLHNDLCNQEQMSESGIITHGQGGKDVFKDAEKFAKELGGEASDYVKKTSTARILADGKTSQVHWVENLKTGQRFNFKTVMENASK